MNIDVRKLYKREFLLKVIYLQISKYNKQPYVDLLKSFL